MMLSSPSKDKCPICAVKHDKADPHNKDSLYYLYRFYGVVGRWPTWADAIAHCTPEMRDAWKSQLEAMGKWSEPTDGQPIADPPGESFHQPIGDINSRTFGTEGDRE